MRLMNCAGLAVAVVLAASIASAQGLGDAAARERDKRKAPDASKPAKVYTQSDLGTASSVPNAAPVPAEGAAAPGAADAAKGEAGPAEKDPEKAAAEAAARAEQEWRNKLGQARTDVSNHQSTVDRLQGLLNDTSSMYTPGWSAAMADLDKTKQKLAEARALVATLEEEGRRAGYR